MSIPIDIQPASDHELVIARLLDAPCDRVYAAWTRPDLLRQWFAPKPWTTADARLDVRPGGNSLVVMRSPEGVDHPNPGVYLEVVPGRKLVMTDAYAEAWVPAEKPFMTLVLTFDPVDGGRTRYVARALHWTIEDREDHERMGFHNGWSICTDQLEQIARASA